jgi:hypothetical protein
MSRSIELKENLRAGTGKIKQKDTWQRIGALAGGSLLGSGAIMLTDKLTNNSSKVLRYGAGTISSGIVAVASLGFGYDNVGYGAGMVSAGQAINTVTSLLFNKNLNELLDKGV